MSVPAVPEPSGDHAQKVANHYNKLEESGLDQRLLSRIFYMRNFNNWIKSVLISETLNKLRLPDNFAVIDVLDLCSGKGGDLLKWKKGKIRHLVCADIAGTSVQQSESRYREGRERDRRQIFTAEFITADCTRTRLKEKYENKDQKFDLVSCQFSFHYSFESYAQAMTMLRNACECLKPGGYFMGTTPDANEIVRRLRASEGNSFGNEVYNISFEDSMKEPFPLFGAKYNFHLEGVVDCPEFLVYFPALEKMAAEFGMKLVEKKSFARYYADYSTNPDHAALLSGMQALEPYPPQTDQKLTSSKPEDYSKAQEFLSQARKSEPVGGGQDPSATVGTMSQAEWDAATVYLVFVFQKVKDVSPPAFFSKSETSEQS